MEGGKERWGESKVGRGRGGLGTETLDRRETEG